MLTNESRSKFTCVAIVIHLWIYPQKGNSTFSPYNEIRGRIQLRPPLLTVTGISSQLFIIDSQTISDEIFLSLN